MQVLIIALLLIVGTPAAALTTSGPADDPESWADYGGTRDATLSSAIGLSAAELDVLLQQLSSDNLEKRTAAASEIRRNAMGSESVIRDALYANHGARNDQVRAVLKIASRNAEKGGMLPALLRLEPASPEHRDGIRAAVRVMGLLAAVYSLDTMAGYKIMLDFSGRYAGAFRQIIGDMLVARKLDALPALIYGRGSRDKELHMFAVTWIRDMGNPLLSEQIQGIRNPRRLAQLLEAYASVKEFDAIDVTLSLADHESVFVRNAARSALVAYGNNAKWPIRRTWENTFNESPAADTDFEQWRETLFAFWDKQRTAEAMKTFERGLEAAEARRFEEMNTGYLAVLLDAPMFPRRVEMALGYLAWSKELEKSGQLEKAGEMNLMALRLADEDSMAASMARARMDWLAAEKNREGGAASIGAYRRVLSADPMNKDAVSRIDELTPDPKNTSSKILKAIAVSVFLFICALIAYFRLRISVRSPHPD